MDAPCKTSLLSTLGLAITAWVAGCELAVDGAPCPCGPGWTCVEDENVCVRPYCVFWTDVDRTKGIDVELPEDLVVVTGYTTGVPPGSDILVTSGGALSITSDDHRIFVEPHGAVFDTGAGNQVYLRDHALYRTITGKDNEIIHEPDANLDLVGPGTTVEERSAIDFLGEIEVPFAVDFREIHGYHTDATERGIADYVVRNGGHLATTARADNVFVDSYGWVLRVDFSQVVYVQRDGYFDAGNKRQVIHHVPGARIVDASEDMLIEHATLDLGLCTR